MTMFDAAIEAEQDRRELDLIDRVQRSFDNCADRRLKELMLAIVKHLHAFLRETRLTEEEWTRAIEFLTAVGRITDDKRQEFILLSDVLGVSMQTIAINNAAYENATEATVFGPFFAEGSPEVAMGGDISGGATGEPCWVHGLVTDTTGHPVANALIEVWEADAEGLYDVQYRDGRIAARAHLYTDADGRYCFWAITPTPYPIPHDGPVGEMLEAVGRSPMRASHLHFMLTAPGCRRLVTHIFMRGDEYLDSDTVFGVKDSLIRDFQRSSATPAPGGRNIDGPWSAVQFDIVLAPAEA